MNNLQMLYSFPKKEKIIDYGNYRQVYQNFISKKYGWINFISCLITFSWYSGKYQSRATQFHRKIQIFHHFFVGMLTKNQTALVEALKLAEYPQAVWFN